MLGGSKKDSKLRRAEVLGSGDSSLAHHLCQQCAQNAADMLRDPLACDIVVEIAKAGADGEHFCRHCHLMPWSACLRKVDELPLQLSAYSHCTQTSASTVLSMVSCIDHKAILMHIALEASSRCSAKYSMSDWTICIGWTQDIAAMTPVHSACLCSCRHLAVGSWQ